MDFYLSCILSILGLIAWIVFIKYATFKTVWVYMLFILAYIFSVLNHILLFIDYIYYRKFNFFFFYSINDYLTIFLLNLTTYIFFLVVGSGLILIRLIPYSIEKIQKVSISKESSKETKEELVAFGSLFGMFLDIQDELEKEKEKKS